MATNRTEPSRKSSNPRTTGQQSGRPGGGPTGVARAPRGDTPEAKDLRRRAPKTHPTRSPGAARKDAEFKPKSRTSGVRRTATANQRGAVHED